MKGKYTFTAHIEKDPETGLLIGYIPALPGAHTQAETLNELQKNLEEVASLCMKEITEVKITNSCLGIFCCEIQAVTFESSKLIYSIVSQTNSRNILLLFFQFCIK